jgi:ABC-type nitrate/sulfonate/bicarbonate transport system substrate-binding protein
MRFLPSARALRAVAIALCAALLAASAAQAEMAKGDGGKVRLLVNPSGTQSFPPFAIQKFALDKKHGFALETVPTTGAQAQTTALQSGSADIGMFGWTDIARMRNAGIGVVGIAPFLTWANTVVVPVDSPIKTLGDLKGKKVGVFTRIGLDWITMRAAAKKAYGVDLETETTVHEGAVPLLRGLIEQSQLDATQMFNDLTPAMVASGKFRVLVRIRDLIMHELALPDTPFLLYTAYGKYAEAKPNNVKAFLAAYQEAMQILQTNDAVWFERAKELKVMEEPVVMELIKASRPALMSKFSPHTENDIRKTFAVLVATAGNMLGMTELPAAFMTVEYQ